MIDPDEPMRGMASFGVRSAIGDTLKLFFNNFLLIATVVIVIVAPFEIVTALNGTDVSNQWELTFWSYLLGAACQVLVAPALIYSLLKVLQTGSAPGVRESYRWGLTKLPKLCICALISTGLQALGSALCIIPGIIVMLSFAVVYPVAVLEKGSVNEVFAQSVQLTRGHRLEILATYIVVGMIILVPAAICGFIIGMANYFPLTVAASIASDVFEHIFTVLSLVLYLSLPRPRETGNVLSLNQ